MLYADNQLQSYGCLNIHADIIEVYFVFLLPHLLSKQVIDIGMVIVAAGTQYTILSTKKMRRFIVRSS